MKTLRERRFYLGETVRSAAKSINVSVNTWLRWESGDLQPTAKHYAELLRQGYLDFETDPETPPTPAEIQRVISRCPFLAEQLKVSKTIIHRWSSGKSLPARRHWATLKNLFLSLDN